MYRHEFSRQFKACLSFTSLSMGRLMALFPERLDASQWFPTRLRNHLDNHFHIIYHTVARQYFPLSVQNIYSRALDTAGKKESITKPLVNLSMEADSKYPSALISMRLWPLDETIQLRRVYVHGRWIW